MFSTRVLNWSPFLNSLLLTLVWIFSLMDFHQMIFCFGQELKANFICFRKSLSWRKRRSPRCPARRSSSLTTSASKGWTSMSHFFPTINYVIVVLKEHYCLCFSFGFTHQVFPRPPFIWTKLLVRNCLILYIHKNLQIFTINIEIVGLE